MIGKKLLWRRCLKKIHDLADIIKEGDFDETENPAHDQREGEGDRRLTNEEQDISKKPPRQSRSRGLKRIDPIFEKAEEAVEHSNNIGRATRRG